MNYAQIKTCDIANGSGVRVSLFVSGCTHHCKNCFNKETWDFNYGDPFTEEVAEMIYTECEPDYITGLTILGGEPLEPQNQRGLYEFMKEFKKRYPQKNIWCYSGYTYEQLTDRNERRCHIDITDEILKMIDILVDGEFADELKDITLRFRGSSNQRIIDMNKTRVAGKITIWEDNPIFATHSM